MTVVRQSLALAVVAGLLAGCSSGSPSRPSDPAASPAAVSGAVVSTPSSRPGAASSGPAAARLLPGMPAPLSPRDVWAADRPGMLSPVVRQMPARVYVPNTMSDTVTVIDPATYRVVATVRVGREPQHVVPSWDLRTLWVNNDKGNSLTPIDPRTGRAGRPVSVHDPYNLYFTPDGRHAVVMASADHELVFRDPHTMAVQKAVPVGCAGVNHADFTADGARFLVSCEFSADLLEVDTARMQVVAQQHLPGGGMPQDVKLSTDGRTFYVADMMRDGVWLVDAGTFRVRGLLRTGKGAHGLYVSRDSRTLYVTNRGEGTISLLDMATGTVRRTWRIPGGGSPDMGGISADGTVLWLSGRYDGVVYAIRTSDGRLLARIRVGSGPHGLCVYPQPGRYSLGHTGVFR